jgi:Ni/Fe-hydrogenase 1 B-type cytochrome subunit
MPPETLKRVKVWSGLLRLCHWTMVLLLGVLFLTAVFVNHAPDLAPAARDYHVMAGHVLVLVVALRVYLVFFGERTDRFTALLPGRLELAAAGAMFKFYLTLGKAALPKWYAHNPLWMPLYLAFYLVLLLELVTGLSHSNNAIIAIETTRSLHALGARILLWFAILHTLAAFWHDYKGTGSDVSAMVSGHRIFVVNRPTSPGLERTLRKWPVESR